MNESPRNRYAAGKHIVIDLRQIMVILQKGYRMIITMSLLIAIGTALISYYMLTPIYQADTLLRFSNATEKVQLYPSATTTATTSSGMDNYIQPVWTMNTHLAQIQSRALMQRVIDKLRLDTYTPEQLSEMINASIVKDSNLIRVTVLNADPYLATQIANTISEQYLKLMNEKIQDQFSSSIYFLTNQLQLSEQQLADAQAELKKYPTRNGDAATRDDLQREVERLKQTSDSLNKQITETLINKSVYLVDNSMVVVSEAAVPNIPVKPNVVQNAIIALILGLIACTITAFVAEYLDNTVKESHDIEEMEMGVLGIIPQDDRLEAGEFDLIALDKPKSAIAEAYRVLRTNLGFAELGTPFRSIMVGSPSSREGKSTIVANLGVVMAQAGSRVIVVDCDLHKPVQHKIFEVDNSRGLTDCLLGKSTVEEAAHKVIRNLTVLTSGPLPTNPTSIFNYQRVQDFWPTLLEKYDYVLVDTPPVRIFADASILASQLEAVMMVACTSVTRKDNLMEARDQFTKANPNLVGAVLNKVKITSEDYDYYAQQEEASSS